MCGYFEIHSTIVTSKVNSINRNDPENIRPVAA